jgi:hypothetical protein
MDHLVSKVMLSQQTLFVSVPAFGEKYIRSRRTACGYLFYVILLWICLSNCEHTGHAMNLYTQNWLTEQVR